MQDARTLSKIAEPALPAIALHRKSLVAKLDEIIGPLAPERRTPRCKLILLCAPAGYGKTTALAEYAHASPLLCCWYFLEAADSDRISFLTCLIASIRQRFPHFGTALDDLLESVIASSSRKPDDWQYFAPILDALIAAINTEITVRFVIILCNYHEINASKGINHLVNCFLKNLPLHCILIIESRAVPSLEVAGLLAYREMVGLGSNMLSLSAQEIQQLAHLQQLPIPSDTEAEQLARLFDGWIMGILLGTRLGGNALLSPFYRDAQKQTEHLSRDLLGMQVSQQYLLIYLVDEIFKYEPEFYAFLKEIAVLELMTPALCNALLDVSDTEVRLQHLERQGLFVTHSGTGSQIVYKCHPILRKLFNAELHRHDPMRFAHLQYRAATLLRKAHDYDQALHHALQAGEEMLAADIIIEVYQDMIAQGHIETLIQWMDMLSSYTVNRHPRLVLMRAKLYIFSGEFARALPLLEQASAKLSERASESNGAEEGFLQAEIDLARSRVFFLMGKYSETQEFCSQVLAILPMDETMLCAEAYNLLGITANLVGQFTSGIAHFQKALQLWGRNTVNRETAGLHSILASSYGAVGNFSLAEHHLSRSLTYWNSLHDEWSKAYNLIRMGMIRYRQGIPDQAEALFNEALTIARGPIHFLRGEAYALGSLGVLYQEQQLYSQSLTFLESSVTLAQQIKDTFLITTATSDLAMTYLLMGDADTAMLLLSELGPQSSIEPGSGYHKVFCKLTFGMILLYQHSYQEAYTALTEVETALHFIGLKRELLQARLRITACLLAQGKREEGMRLLAELTTFTIRDGYEQIALVELKRLPMLYNLVITRVEYSALRIALNMDQKEQTQQEVETQVLIVLPQTASSSSVDAEGRIEIPVAIDPPLKVLALGEPEVSRDGIPITRWRMARAMELSFFLLEANRPMRKEQIIDSLWPEADEHVDQTFRSTIFYLRKTLGEMYLQYHNGAYRLDTNAIWYDVSVFCQHYGHAKESLCIKDDVAAKAELLKMVDLYRGDYVQSFYSNWCTFRRDELRHIYLEGRSQLAHISWRLEQFDESILHWQHMLVIDSCLEDAHYGLMRCFLKQGKRGFALRQYQRCEAILREELGVVPGNAIQTLYQRLAG